MIYSGGSDNLVRDQIDRYLNSPAVKRFIVEQTPMESLVNHPKVTMVPLGLCARENTGQNGKDLRIQTALQLPFMERKERVFFCFPSAHDWYYPRRDALAFAIKNCTFCDVCNGTQSHSDLWHAFGECFFITVVPNVVDFIYSLLCRSVQVCIQPCGIRSGLFPHMGNHDPR